MKEETVTDAALRQFLLGDVDDGERQRIESLFVTGTLSNDRILTAEQDLVEEYLEDSLTPADKQKFLTQYGNTPAQWRKVSITKSIKAWAAGENKIVSAGASTTSFAARLSQRLGVNPMFAIPIAAAAVIAIVIAVIWLSSTTEQRNRLGPLNEELARLNDARSLQETPPGLISLTLQTGSLRSVEAQQELVKAADAETVELRLVWRQREHYSGYRAVVRKVSSGESLTLPTLRAENDGTLIRLRVPARLLSRGLYSVELTGIGADGSTGPSEEYSFTVSS